MKILDPTEIGVGIANLSRPESNDSARRAKDFAPAGTGILRLAQVRGKTVVTQAQATSPLKLLNPRSHSKSAWVFTSTYGGGLVAGDTICMDVELGDSTTCLLGTQASTKLYRSPMRVPCRQTLNARIGAGAMLISAPHPVTCFKQARFVQRQRFDVAPGGCLVMVDWLTSGRHATGERWTFDRYDNRTDIFVGGRHIVRDSLRLDAEDGPIDSFHRTGGFNCLAYAVVLGQRVREDALGILNFVERCPIPFGTNVPLLFSASPIEGGVILRAAGVNAEIVARWLRERLQFVPALLGEDPWDRLW